jgi:hypothetical protein
MKFMVMMRANANTEAGVMPSTEQITAMMKFNEELVKAGVILAGEGLHPSKNGARLQFEGGKVTVIDGPFPETKELIAGFWLWNVKSRDEAIAWAKRIPSFPGHEQEVELRQVFSPDDFGPALTPELREQEERLRREGEAKARA